MIRAAKIWFSKFRFVASRAASNMPPRPITPARILDARIDEVDELHGFVAREPIQKLTRRKPSEPPANLNIRPPVSTFNRFLIFCEQNRMSYPEALKELMDRAGV
ncbi:hypothetical protein [Ciceribacter selenitireducens]